MNLSQKIAFNTAVQFIGRIFTAASSLVITMLISWKLGAEGLGQYIRIVSYVTIWFVLLDFGINPIAVRTISKIKNLTKQQEALKENFKMLLGLRTAVTLVILIVSTVILYLLPDENYTPVIRQSIMIAYIQILGQSIVSSSMPIFQVTLTYFWATLSNLIGSILSLILVGFVILQGGGLLEIVGASMVGWILIAILTYYFAGKKAGFVLPEFNFRKWMPLLKQALPVGIALLFNVIFVKLNMQLLQVLEINQEVVDKYGNVDAQTGYYGIALRFFDIMITVPFYFSNAIYPILIQRKEESLQRLKDFMAKAVNIMLMVGIPLSVGGVILSKQLIYYVSGGFLPGADPAEFLPAIPALQILLLGVALFYTTGVTSWTSIIVNKQWLLPKIYGVVVVFNLALNLFFIPQFGYLGAVFTTVISELLAMILHTYYTKKLIDFRFDLGYFLKALLAASIMGLCVYPLRDSFIVIPFVIGVLSYGIVGLILEVVDKELIRQVWRR